MEQEKFDIDQWEKAIGQTIDNIDRLVEEHQPHPNENAILYRSLEKILSRIERQRTIRRRWIYGIAASVAIAVGLFSFQNLVNHETENYREIKTSYGEKYIVALPDGSRVWLNACSKLTYPEQFKKKTREVHIDGEGFFEISKNPDAPFIVNTNQMQIEVLGTSFNVHDYSGDKKASVSLETGKIKLKLPDNPEYGINLSPGKAAIHNAGEPDCKIINNDNYTYSSAWRDDRLNFYNTSIEEVIKTLERKYDISVSIADPDIETYSYTFCSRQESLNDILNRMKLITPIMIRKTSDKHYYIYKRQNLD